MPTAPDTLSPPIRHQPPGPGPLALLRALPRFARDPLRFLEEAAHHGDLVRLPVPGGDSYLVTHPALIEKLLLRPPHTLLKSRGQARTSVLFGAGLLTSEGAAHRQQRRLVQPAFHHERIAAYAEIMTSRAQHTATRWAARGVHQPVEMLTEMSHLTMAIVGETLFGESFERDAATISHAVTVASELFPLLLMPFSPLLERLPLPPFRRFGGARATLDALVYRLIRERQARGPTSGDLLDMLLAARDEAGQPLSLEAVRDQVMTIFLVGHDTIATALTWAWLLLAQHPAAEAALHAELDSVLGGRPPTRADVPRLTTTRHVLAEAMRLYPPVWSVGRRTREAFELGGYRIPAGAALVASQWVTHRDPRLFPNPLHFDPQRWAGEESSRPRFAFFPFGGGARLCIGEPFAWMEGVLLLATLAQRWQPRLLAAQWPAPHPLIILRPRGGALMRLEPRTVG